MWSGSGGGQRRQRSGTTGSDDSDLPCSVFKKNWRLKRLVLLLLCGVTSGNAAEGGIYFPVLSGCSWCESLSQHSLVGGVCVRNSPDCL